MAINWTQQGAGFAQYPRGPADLRQYYTGAETNTLARGNAMNNLFRSGGNIIQKAGAAGKLANAGDISAYNMVNALAKPGGWNMSRGIAGLSDQQLASAWDLEKREQARNNARGPSGLSGFMMRYGGPAIMSWAGGGFPLPTAASFVPQNALASFVKGYTTPRGLTSTAIGRSAAQR